MSLMMKSRFGRFPFRSPHAVLIGLASSPKTTKNVVGQSSQSKTIHAGVDGQTGVCQAKMGTGVQGFPREHRWLHEPPAGQYGGIPRWTIDWDAW